MISFGVTQLQRSNGSEHHNHNVCSDPVPKGDRKNDHMWSPDASDLRSPMTARELLF